MNPRPNHSAFIRELLGEDYAGLIKPRERYEVRGFIDGCQIFDRGELIVTVRGSNLGLASKILKALKEEAQ